MGTGSGTVLTAATSSTRKTGAWTAKRRTRPAVRATRRCRSELMQRSVTRPAEARTARHTPETASSDLVGIGKSRHQDIQSGRIRVVRYVLDVIYDDRHQECKNDECTWRGGRYDEPFSTCPLCGNGLIVHSEMSQRV